MNQLPTTLKELYLFYLDNCIDEDVGEIPLSFKEWTSNHGAEELIFIKNIINEMDIIENNKLIAEFLGFKFNKHRKAYRIPQMGFAFQGKIEDLKFHSSWNWLMKVIDKIYNLYKDENFKFYSNLEGVNLYSVIKTSFIEDINIDYTYSTVIEYIEWYNKNK